MKTCPKCNTILPDNAAFCQHCGAPQPQTATPPPPHNPYGGYSYGWTPQMEHEYYARNDAFASGPTGKSRGVAALLALFLGYLGIQYFYCGKTTAGILSIVIGLCSCGAWSIVTLIQAILMFTMDNATFQRKYVLNDQTFPLF